MGWLPSHFAPAPIAPIPSRLQGLRLRQSCLKTNRPGWNTGAEVGRLGLTTVNERAVDSLNTAVRINPHSSAAYSGHLAFSNLALGKTDLAVSNLEAVTERWPDYSPAYAYLAMVYQLAGREAEARQLVATLPDVAPDATLRAIERRFSPMQDRQVADRILAAAQQSGIR